MRKFIKRALFFCLLPALAILLTIYSYLSYVVNKSIDEYKIDQHIHTLMIGDSHIEQSINDTIIKHSLNLARSSESYLYSYYKLKSLLTSNPQIDTVFLGVSYHSFSAYYDESNAEVDVAMRYFYLLPLSEQIELVSHAKSSVSYVIESIKKMQDVNLYADWLGAFGNHVTDVKISDSIIDKRISGMYFTHKQLQGFSTTNEKYLHAIHQLCISKHVKLILIETPLHIRHKSKIPLKFKWKLKQILKQSNIDVIDCSKFQYYDEDFLPDGDHVSKLGSLKTTNIVKDFIGKNLKS
jgi:hypothetical protein